MSGTAHWGQPFANPSLKECPTSVWNVPKFETYRSWSHYKTENMINNIVNCVLNLTVRLAHIGVKFGIIPIRYDIHFENLGYSIGGLHRGVPLTSPQGKRHKVRPRGSDWGNILMWF